MGLIRLAIMKSHFRFIRPGLGGMVAFCLLVTGPLSPLAQAKNEETKSNYWESRKKPFPSKAQSQSGQRQSHPPHAIGAATTPSRNQQKLV
jgi:hypothetical protein